MFPECEKPFGHDARIFRQDAAVLFNSPSSRFQFPLNQDRTMGSEPHGSWINIFPLEKRKSTAVLLAAALLLGIIAVATGCGDPSQPKPKLIEDNPPSNDNTRTLQTFDSGRDFDAFVIKREAYGEVLDYFSGDTIKTQLSAGEWERGTRNRQVSIFKLPDEDVEVLE